jgi:hypothetical protein
MTKAQLQKRLDAIAVEINAITAELTKQYGEESNLYFEAGGNICAMKPEPALRPGRTSLKDRQALVIASNNEHCNFDCGAW